MAVSSNTYRKKILSSCIFLLLGLAFAVKAMLPAGFMPVFNEQGSVEIVICSGIGTKTVSVPMEEGDISSSEHNEQADKICDYQILISASAVPSSPELNIVLTALSLLKADAPMETAESMSAVYSFAARGPPSV